MLGRALRLAGFNGFIYNQNSSLRKQTMLGRALRLSMVSDPGVVGSGGLRKQTMLGRALRRKYFSASRRETTPALLRKQTMLGRALRLVRPGDDDSAPVLRKQTMLGRALRPIEFRHGSQRREQAQKADNARKGIKTRLAGAPRASLQSGRLRKQTMLGRALRLSLGECA